MLAHAFAQKTIVGLEELVRTGVVDLVAQFDTYASSKKEMNVRRVLNYFAIDFMGLVLFGESLDCVRRGDDLVDATSSEGDELYQVPFVKTLHNIHMHTVLTGAEPALLPLTSPLLSWHPGVRSGKDWGNVIKNLYHKRLAVPDPESQPDVFSKFLRNSKGEEMNLDPAEIMVECAVIMNAGSETNTAALVSVIYHIYKHPAVLERLRGEIDAAVPLNTGQDIPPYHALAALPYLRACIDEGLRIQPASTQGFPRVVPKGGRMIAGRFVEEGVTVSVHPFPTAHPICIPPVLTYIMNRYPHIPSSKTRQPSKTPSSITPAGGLPVINPSCTPRSTPSVMVRAPALVGIYRILNMSWPWARL